ncbi:putative methyltransferase-domain-containing protein [Daldinia caldariorum]|uniref:putative methyltransferase-domain-containing protein n=1 Tax=Daldinia caldariorum TaxID=326644 RepID=UPI002007FBD1|nr:putative methyltransferase-domain-containing protein [Daldinia caldariorum]KAI1472121.1 putative methyltransferase-domain-containing protein [Daldinia caldariorum]
MSFHDVDPQLLLLRRQYIQLFEPDFLAWPPAKFLKDADVQKWLYKHLFDPSRNQILPPEGYQLRVLKKLVTKLEKETENGEEDGVLGELTARFKSFIAIGVSSEFRAAQEETYVTFTCLTENYNPENSSDCDSEPTITLLERRQLVLGSQITGFRTWEASLHLGSYLLTDAGSQIVRGKNILELGAGAGFLSILLAKHLHAKHVTTTDGDEGVVESIRENLSLNGLNTQGKVKAGTLTWGHDPWETWIKDDCDVNPYDVVIGADITYNTTAISALVSTLHKLIERRSKLRVIIAGVVRNAATFQKFRDDCTYRHFAVEEVHFEPKSMRQQKALFYAAAVPIKILSINGAG